MMKYKRGMVALSGDPITRGHKYLFDQAAQQCDSLVIYVTDNDSKKGSYLYTQEERVDLIRASKIKYDVVTGSLPLVDMYLREGCDVLFRGIRDQKDEAYEDQQMFYHRLIYPDLNVEYIVAPEHLKHISSTVVKSFAYHHIDVSDMVTLPVKASLERRMHRQTLIGVTGCIGSGKTWVCEALATQLRSKGVRTHVINMDTLIRDLYDEDSPGSQIVRDKIQAMFPEETLLTEDRKIDRNKLKGLLSPDTLKEIYDLTYPHVMRLLRSRLSGITGLILIEWARLIENDFTHLTNNVVIVVDSPDRDCHLRRREYTDHTRKALEHGQYSTEEKMTRLQNSIRGDHYGKAILYINRDDDNKILELSEQILAIYPLRPTCQNK